MISKIGDLARLGGSHVFKRITCLVAVMTDVGREAAISPLEVVISELLNSIAATFVCCPCRSSQVRVQELHGDIRRRDLCTSFKRDSATRGAPESIQTNAPGLTNGSDSAPSSERNASNLLTGP